MTVLRHIITMFCRNVVDKPNARNMKVGIHAAARSRWFSSHITALDTTGKEITLPNGWQHTIDDV